MPDTALTIDQEVAEIMSRGIPKQKLVRALNFQIGLATTAAKKGNEEVRASAVFNIACLLVVRGMVEGVES